MKQIKKKKKYTINNLVDHFIHIKKIYNNKREKMIFLSKYSLLNTTESDESGNN